jgi:hypothetical protein
MVEQVTAVTLAERQAALVVAAMSGQGVDTSNIPSVSDELKRLDDALVEPLAVQHIGREDIALRRALNLER